MKFTVRIIFLVIFSFAQFAPALAERPDSAGAYAPFWIKKDALFTQQSLQNTLEKLAEQEDDPEQIFVFIHGFKKPWEGSTRDFKELAERVRTQLEKDDIRVGIVGVQWDSSTEIKSSKGVDALRMMRAYREAVPLARSVGYGPTRALLLALQEKYPKAHLSVFAHSMGCEVAAAAVLPEIQYQEYEPFLSPFKPAEAVKLDLLVLAGSDLDYDFWYKSGVSPGALEERTRITWLTVADYLTKGDKVLNTRRRVRGRAAGSSFPRMTLEQLDQTVSERRLFIDQRNIPRKHQFLEYYKAGRLARILSVLRYLTVPRATEPREMEELDEILAAPNKLDVLLPYLDRPSYASKFYALWRIERINCGDARHMTDLTLEEISNLIRTAPQKIEDLRSDCICLSVRRGQFPSVKMMNQAGLPAER